MSDRLQNVTVEPKTPSKADIAGGPVLVVDLSPLHIQVFLVHPEKTGWEIAKASGEDISWSGNGDVPEQELKQAVSRLVALSGSTAKKATLILPHEIAFHELMAIPKMGEKDRKRIFSRKIDERAGSHDDDVAFEAVSMGRARESTKAQKESFLVTAAPRKALLLLHDILRQAGLNPTCMTPAQACLLGLAQAIRPREDATGWAMLDLSSTFATLSIQSGPTLILLRSIRFQATADATTIAEKLAGEMHRSLLFYQQKFPGEGVERIVVTSHFPGRAQTVGEALTNALEQEVFLLNPLELIRNADGDLGESADHLSNVSRLVGYLVSSGTNTAINLNPPEIRAKKRQITSTIGLLFVLAAAGVAGHLFTSEIPAMTEDASRLMRESNQRLRSMESVTSDHANVITRKTNLQALHQAYEEFTKRKVDWRAFFNQISALPRQDLRCQKITLFPREDTSGSSGSATLNWYATLGCLANGSFVETQKLMREAATGLRDAPSLERVNVKPPSGRPKRQFNDDDEDPMTPFEIECRLRFGAESSKGT